MRWCCSRSGYERFTDFSCKGRFRQRQILGKDRFSRGAPARWSGRRDTRITAIGNGAGATGRPLEKAGPQTCAPPLPASRAPDMSLTESEADCLMVRFGNAADQYALAVAGFSHISRGAGRRRHPDVVGDIDAAFRDVMRGLGAMVRVVLDKFIDIPVNLRIDFRDESVNFSSELSKETQCLSPSLRR